MKVTIDNVVFEGTSEEVYEVLNKLGYSIERVIPLKSIEKEEYPIKPPYTNPYPINPPWWVQPYTVGDPPPGTYPNVWCGSGSTITTMKDFDAKFVDDTPTSDDQDRLDS